MSEEQRFEEWWSKRTTKEMVRTVFCKSLRNAMLDSWQARASIEAEGLRELEAENAALVEALSDLMEVCFWDWNGEPLSFTRAMEKAKAALARAESAKGESDGK